MIAFRCITIAIPLILLTFCNGFCAATQDTISEDIEKADIRNEDRAVAALPENEKLEATLPKDLAVEAPLQNEPLKTTATSESNIVKDINKESGSADKKIIAKELIRVVTKEELAFHDGKQTPKVWLSIMSKVFDVTAGPEYYSEAGPYHVFVGRDGNVPFITGVFNAEEASKPASSMDAEQLSSLQHWVQFYIDEERYPFIGLLEGDLYDKDGNPTEEMKLVQDKIDSVQEIVAARKMKTAKIIERRKKEDDERKKKKQEQFTELKKNKVKGEKANNNVFSFIRQFFQGNHDKEL